jgi:hypothetical protein
LALTIGVLVALAAGASGCSRSEIPYTPPPNVSRPDSDSDGSGDAGPECRAVGSKCRAAVDCCSGACGAGYCLGTPERCAPDGVPCEPHCCAAACTEGRCGKARSPVGCLAGGASCTSASECCTNACESGGCTYAACYPGEGLTLLVPELPNFVGAIARAGDQVYFEVGGDFVALAPTGGELRAVSVYGGPVRTVPTGDSPVIRVASGIRGLVILHRDGSLDLLDPADDRTTRLRPPRAGSTPIWLEVEGDEILWSADCTSSAGCAADFIDTKGLETQPFSYIDFHANARFDAANFYHPPYDFIDTSAIIIHPRDGKPSVTIPIPNSGYPNTQSESAVYWSSAIAVGRIDKSSRATRSAAAGLPSCTVDGFALYCGESDGRLYYRDPVSLAPLRDIEIPSGGHPTWPTLVDACVVVQAERLPLGTGAQIWRLPRFR